MIQRLLRRAEGILACTAERAAEVVRDILPSSTRGDAQVGIAFFSVKCVAADRTDILHCKRPLYSVSNWEQSVPCCHGHVTIRA